MNKTYEAIIALGRSIVDLGRYGWTKGDVGFCGESKCATGLLTQATVGQPQYFGDMEFALEFPNESITLQQASWALYVALSERQKEALARATEDVDLYNSKEVAQESLRMVREGNATQRQYETVVVVINDKVMRSDVEVRRWFSDAIDVLAQELPVPAAPLFEGAPAEPVLV